MQSICSSNPDSRYDANRSFGYDAYMFNLSIQILYAISSYYYACMMQTSRTDANKPHGYNLSKWFQCNQYNGYSLSI